MTSLQPIKLSELSKVIDEVVQSNFGDTFYWVIAEISGHKFYPDKDRHYFQLIEKGDATNEPIVKIEATTWDDGAKSILVFESQTGQKFQNGLQILAKVKVQFHPVFGLKLLLRDIDYAYTLGAIERMRAETLLKLVNLNPRFIQQIDDQLITRNKQIELNPVIQKIALIGSPNSEGYADFVHTLRSNPLNYKFRIDTYFSSVQGAEAERDLINSLISIYNAQTSYDCVVIIRGGGAKSDFIVFDAYQLSRAVAKFPIPIITGIGHHQDVSIVDKMAHTSTKTPTMAAEFILDHCQQFEEKVNTLQQLIVIKSQTVLHNASRNSTRVYMQIANQSRTVLNNKISAITSLQHTIRSQSQSITSNSALALRNTVQNLIISQKNYISKQRMTLNHQHDLIRLMSPDSVLKRGYAIVTLKDKIITNPDLLNNGDTIVIQLKDTLIASSVLEKLPANKNASNDAASA